MRKMKLHHNHQCCPEEWKGVSDMTGSYEMDGMIQRTSNKDMADRLESHLVSDVAYTRNRGYGKGSLG